MRSLIALLLVGSFVVLGPRVLRAQQFVDTRLEVTDTLHDVAVTTIRNGRETIHSNPTLLSLLGPALTDFMMAHEYGHAFYGHDGGALLAGQPEFDRVRVRQELEAVEFFGRFGPVRFDRVHSSGEQRAAVILACAR